MRRLFFRLSLTRDAPVLLSQRDAFHGLALEAHIVELYANAIGAFVSSIKKPYFLDPVFFKFTDDFFEAVSEKRWVDLLLKPYGIEDLIAASPDGFEAPEIQNWPSLGRVVASILNYQRTRIANLSQKMIAFADLIGETTPKVGPPEFLVAPYTIATDRASIRTNLRLAKEAVRVRKEGEQVYAVVAI